MTRKFRVVLPVVLILSMAFAVDAQCQVVGRGDYFGPQSVSSTPMLHGTDLGTADENITLPGRANGLMTNNLSMMSQPGMALPEYSPVLMDATALGLGAVGSFPLSSHFFVRVSLITLMPYDFQNGAAFYSNSMSGLLLPIQIGTTVPFYRSRLGSLNYTLYGQTSAGLLLGWAAPINNGSFLGYSFVGSRFGSGASAYMGIGNSVRMSRFVGLYLNAGLGYLNFFSTSFLPHSSYLVPDVAVGFSFNLAP